MTETTASDENDSNMDNVIKINNTYIDRLVYRIMHVCRPPGSDKLIVDILTSHSHIIL